MTRLAVLILAYTSCKTGGVNRQNCALIKESSDKNALSSSSSSSSSSASSLTSLYMFNFSYHISAYIAMAFLCSSVHHSDWCQQSSSPLAYKMCKDVQSYLNKYFKSSKCLKWNFSLTYRYLCKIVATKTIRGSLSRFDQLYMYLTAIYQRCWWQGSVRKGTTVAWDWQQLV